MQAIILAGGVGTRLQPLTDHIPKPLIPISSVPIIEWQIIFLKKFGLKKFIICSGYLSTQIELYLKSHNNFDVDIHVSSEPSKLGTGGAIKYASKYIEEDSFFVINGDVLASIDIKKLKINSIAAVHLPTEYGILDIQNDHIVQFKEKQTLSEHWINAGIYHLSSNVLNDLPDKGNIETSLFPTYAKNKMLKCVKFHDAIFYSIDSHKDREECGKNIDKIKNIWDTYTPFL